MAGKPSHDIVDRLRQGRATPDEAADYILEQRRKARAHIRSIAGERARRKAPAAEFAIGQGVEKVGGRYQGPGIIRGYAWMPQDGGYWLYTVGMQVAGGAGEFAHVFRAAVLRPRSEAP